jgi:hypothetical protein
MWPFGSKSLQAKLRMPMKQAGTMYGMFATVVVARGDPHTLNGVVRTCGERHFTGRFGKFSCVARAEPTEGDGIDFVISATASGQPAPDFHRELAAVLTERVTAFNVLLKDRQAAAPNASAPAAQLVK